MHNILKCIPGFRSGKKYKMIIAIIYYVFALTMLTEGIGYGLIYFATPFLIFSFIDLFKHKKKSIPLKTALVPLLASLALLILGMSISPTVEIPEAEGQLIVDDDEIISEDNIQSDMVSKEDETISNDSLDMESEEIEETLDLADSVKDEPSIEATQTPVKADSKLEVHFIDVGQGDASLVICDGEVMLIDGGNPENSSLIYTYLKNNGIKHLDYIVNTHAHADHVGGLVGALNYATVGTAFSSVDSYDSRAFKSFVKYLNEQNVSITIPNAGDEFNLGSAIVQVLSSSNRFNDENNRSIVLKVTHGKTSFLFTGDAEREAEQALIDSETNLSSTVLHVGHHGSNTSTTYPFLREIMPEYGVISVGSNNSYGHPTEGVLSKLRDADVKVLRTDMQGDIIFTSNGTNVSFTAERNTNVDTLASVSKETTSATPKETTSPTKEVVNTEPTSAETTNLSSERQEDITESKYILNINSKKIHYPNCNSVNKMSEINKEESNLSRDELINQGYDPCGNCKP